MPTAVAPSGTALALAAAVMALGSASAMAHARRRRLAAVLKMGAATGYLALALEGGAAGSPYGRALLAGLALCWLGDLLLIPEGKSAAFLAGLGSFLLGHVAYAGAFVLAGISSGWATGAAVPVAGAGVIVLRWLRASGLPAPMRGPVLAYVVAISAMVALAWGAAGADAPWTVPAGAMAFMASDVFVARQRFVSPSPWNTTLGLPLYFLAQVLLALSV